MQESTTKNCGQSATHLPVAGIRFLLFAQEVQLKMLPEQVWHSESQFTHCPDVEFGKRPNDWQSFVQEKPFKKYPCTHDVQLVIKELHV